MKNHSVLLFLFAVLAPFTMGASVALTVTGTAAVTGGFATDMINDLTYQLEPHIRRQSKIEEGIKEDMKFLEDLLIMYLGSIADYDEDNKIQDKLSDKFK